MYVYEWKKIDIADCETRYDNEYRTAINLFLYIL